MIDLVLWVELGEQLRTARTARHLYQRDIAFAAGVSTATYGMIERGLTRPGAAVLERLAAYLALDLAELRRLAAYDLPPRE
jgi:transcriptional regulator with XRE-family HTH domain